jgi:hypothetical protein
VFRSLRERAATSEARAKVFLSSWVDETRRTRCDLLARLTSMSEKFMMRNRRRPSLAYH